MLKRGYPVLVLGLLLAFARPAQAQWAGDFVHSVGRDFIRNNAWPEPFIRADRESVMAPARIMAANGWRHLTLLCDEHFNDDNAQLNHAGEQQLRWILTSVPPQHRTVYVQRGTTPVVTRTRLDVVQGESMRLLPDGDWAQIVPTGMSGEGSSADRIDALSRKALTSMPDPKLPPPPAPASGGP